MSDWTSGYVADVGYTYGYYPELNPIRNNLALINAGFAPAVSTNISVCELGFGQGGAIVIHAAAQPTTQFWGTDFNPAQAEFAQHLANDSGAGAQLFDQTFEEFCQRTDLPDFDVIGLHGIWTWISVENKKIIVDFVRRKLKVGGVLFVSYNTQPGWAAMLPVRRLMTQHAEVMGSRGEGRVARVSAALDFTEELFKTNPVFTRKNPMIVDRLKKIKELDRDYVAHEYFNRDWTPMPFADMADWLEPAKLTFACSAHYQDHVDAANFTPDQLTFLKSVLDVGMRETVRDFMVNQHFRRDFWIKGGRRLSAMERLDTMRRQRVVLVQSRYDVEKKIVTVVGEIILKDDVYGPILDFLADNQSRNIGEIEQVVASRGLGIDHVIQTVVILISTGALQPAQEPDVAASAKPYTDKLNTSLIQKSLYAKTVQFLASPVTGGGIAVPRIIQIFLYAISLGNQKPEQYGEFTCDRIMALGERMIKDGKPLVSREENLADMRIKANAFESKFRPLLVKLGVV